MFMIYDEENEHYFHYSTYNQAEQHALDVAKTGRPCSIYNQVHVIPPTTTSGSLNTDSPCALRGIRPGTHFPWTLGN